jgi:hypothetical protein
MQVLHLEVHAHAESVPVQLLCVQTSGDAQAHPRLVVRCSESHIMFICTTPS